MEGIMKLRGILNTVNDRESFLEFVRFLMEDWNEDQARIEERKRQNTYSPVWDNSEWQNGGIGSFLEAALAWADVIPMGPNKKRLAEPSWKGFAEFLYAGKVYE
jgi:hypothetical protein